MGKGWKNPHKEAQAQQKGKLFTKVAREIAVAAKLGGPDPEGNSRLKMAIEAAKAVSCPKETIERSIKKGSGQLDDNSQIDELTYEGLGPGGIGIIVECQTDNRNRTVSDLRGIFRKHDSNLGESGSVAWMFDHLAIVVASTDKDVDAEEAAIEVGANEVEAGEEGKQWVFWGAKSDLDAIRTGLTTMGWNVSVAEFTYRAKNFTRLEGEQLEAANALLAALDDCDDSHRVHSTLE